MVSRIINNICAVLYLMEFEDVLPRLKFALYLGLILVLEMKHYS